MTKTEFAKRIGAGNKIKIYEKRSVDNEQGEGKSVESYRGKDKRISEIVG